MQCSPCLRVALHSLLLNQSLENSWQICFSALIVQQEDFMGECVHKQVLEKMSLIGTRCIEHTCQECSNVDKTSMST